MKFYDQYDEAEAVKDFPQGSGKGKSFIAIFPHSDDFTIFTAGLMVKLLRAGYEGYFIRTTNDEHDSSLSPGGTHKKLEEEMDALQAELGIKARFDFGYKNHYMDPSQLIEIRHRLISLFRFIKPQCVISFDPCGHYEENPDHYVTALAVEQACWMSGCGKDLSELTAMGITPWGVREKFYVARGPQLVNLVLDIGDVREEKARSIACNASPIGGTLAAARAQGSTEYTALKDFAMETFCAPRRPMAGTQYYEAYHHITGEYI